MTQTQNYPFTPNYGYQSQRTNQSRRPRQQDHREPRGPRSVCLDYLNGVCHLKRPTCKFAHPPASELAIDTTALRNVKGSVCGVWASTGTCKFGNRCRDAHPPLKQDFGCAPALTQKMSEWQRVHALTQAAKLQPSLRNRRDQHAPLEDLKLKLKMAANAQSADQASLIESVEDALIDIARWADEDEEHNELFQVIDCIFSGIVTQTTKRSGKTGAFCDSIFSKLLEFMLTKLPPATVSQRLWVNARDLLTKALNDVEDQVIAGEESEPQQQCAGITRMLCGLCSSSTLSPKVAESMLQLFVQAAHRHVGERGTVRNSQLAYFAVHLACTVVALTKHLMSDAVQEACIKDLKAVATSVGPHARELVSGTCQTYDLPIPATPLVVLPMGPTFASPTSQPQAAVPVVEAEQEDPVSIEAELPSSEPVSAELPPSAEASTKVPVLTPSLSIRKTPTPPPPVFALRALGAGKSLPASPCTNPQPKTKWADMEVFDDDKLEVSSDIGVAFSDPTSPLTPLTPLAPGFGTFAIPSAVSAGVFEEPTFPADIGKAASYPSSFAAVHSC